VASTPSPETTVNTRKRRARARRILGAIAVAVPIGIAAVLVGLWFEWLPLCAKAAGVTFFGVAASIAVLLELAGAVRRSRPP